MTAALRFLPVPVVRCALLLALVVLGGCATQTGLIVDPHREPPKLFQPKPVAVLEGKASFYADPQKTANGERFNPKDYTAAHKKLPFDTTVRVINLKNNKAVLVRINDRGPYIRGRIIDLSLQAAQDIDMVRSGVVPVRVEVLAPIEIVEKPNLHLTPRMKEEAQKRAAEAAKSRTKPSAKPPLNPKPEPVIQSTPEPTSSAGSPGRTRQRRVR